MDKKPGSQLDLFSQGRISTEEDAPRSSSTRFSDIRKYEKTLLITIGFIVTVIVSFSLGVEKGKRLAAVRPLSGFDTARAAKPVIIPEQPYKPAATPVPAAVLKTVPQKTAPAPIPAAAPAPAQEPAAVPVIAGTAGNFTIQIASFKAKAHAVREMEILKQKGQPAYIAPQGKYTVLYVGKFKDKETARSLLSELKKNYQDCFIRRL
jgi:cell division septation protein DedD